MLVTIARGGATCNKWGWGGYRTTKKKRNCCCGGGGSQTNSRGFGAEDDEQDDNNGGANSAIVWYTAPVGMISTKRERELFY